MKRFNPVFKDDKDKIITLGIIIFSMFFYIFPPLIALFISKEYISENTYEISKTLFNFELFLFLISLFFLVPVIGWIVGFIVAPILAIWNIIIVIMNICAIAGNNQIKIPEPYKFI